jgi:Tfp pilus assembly protein PilN
MRRATLLIFLALAGCESFQDQCIRLEARDVYLLDRQISEAQANLARGHALDTVITQELRWVRCGVNDDGSVEICQELVDIQRIVPRAIDPAAEQRRLAALEQKRREVATTLAPQIAACKARYP